MAEVKFFEPFPQNDNFDTTAVEKSESTNTLFIANRLKRGEHVTFENSGLNEKEWQNVIKRFGTE
jgi:hypothetical protein